MKIIIASGPVIVEDNKVLLDQHGDDNFWKFCGGKVEDFNLNLIKTAEKKVKEEMGINIEIVNPDPFFLLTIKEKEGEKIDVILVHFLAKRIGEIEPGADVREWKWIPISQLKDFELAPNILPTLKHFNFIQ